MEERRCYGCMQMYEGDTCPVCGWPSNKNNEPHQLSVGTVLQNQYEVGRVLGQGGFGITYLGWDRQLQTAVCIKEYFPNHAVSRDCSVSTQVHCHTEAGAAAFRISKERFLREGRVLARFRDIPEIVSVYGSFEANDTVYIVMEYIRGMDLARYINRRGGRLTAEETFRILKPVMEALATVHRGELVHRDIAPDNIMLHPRGGAKLLDFGAARMVENADVDRGLDRSTEAIVKHGFAPMEQYQTRGNLGPWTDVYAMCATVYYCLTGQIPPEATTRLMGEADFSWAAVPGLSDRQRYALEKGMAVLPKDRYRTMEELLEGLFGTGALDPVPEYPQSEPVPDSRWPGPAAQKPAKRKGRGMLIALAAVFAVAVLGVGGFFIASFLQGALRGSHAVPASTYAPAAPAAEAPATEAPAAEAPAPELNIGIVATPAAEQLIKAVQERLAERGTTFQTTFVPAASTEEVFGAFEAHLATGCNVIMFQGLEPDAPETEELLAMSEACGVQVILFGYDPSYGTGDDSLLERYSNVCYVGADPRYLADRLAFEIATCDADTDGSGSLGYVFLKGESTQWENASLEERLPRAMEEMGVVCNLLAEGYGVDCASVLAKALTSYGDQVEIILCTDKTTVDRALEICEAFGLDIRNKVRIIAMGAPEDMDPLLEEGRIAGYVAYSLEMQADTLVEVLLKTASGQTVPKRVLVGE